MELRNAYLNIDNISEKFRYSWWRTKLVKSKRIPQDIQATKKLDFQAFLQPILQAWLSAYKCRLGANYESIGLMVRSED